MVRCTATAKSTGLPCKNSGDPSKGYRCARHAPYQKCRGRKPDGTPCGSRTNAAYDGYCGAAHDPEFNAIKPEILRDEEEMRKLRPKVRQGEKDVYTGSRLVDGQCDHYVELQIAAHAMNYALNEYRGYARAVHGVVPVVKEYINDESNLGYTHEDINKLKGAATTSYLNGITYSCDVSWTTSLINAHKQLNWATKDGMRIKSLERSVTRTISKTVVSKLKKLQYDLDGEADDRAMELVVERLGFLVVEMKK